MSVALGESRLGRQGGLPNTWGSSLGVLQGLGEQEASLQPWHPLVELLQKERPAQLSRLCSGALIQPGGWDWVISLKQMLRRSNHER